MIIYDDKRPGLQCRSLWHCVKEKGELITLKVQKGGILKGIAKPYITNYKLPYRWARASTATR
jgi:hypothetical protein